MDFVKIILFISLIYGLFAELKVPAGSCVSKIVNGKLVQVGDCKKDDGSEIARLIKRSRDEKKKAQVKCDVTYKSKCFRVVVYTVLNVTVNDGKVICKSMKYGKPANIYDQKHLKLLLTYLRSLIPAGKTTLSIWTGMEYKNNQLFLSSGEPITIATEDWFPTYPKSDALNTNVAVRVDNDPKNKYQRMSNTPPSWTRNGVICEI
uniref:uncharacterized protein LOC120343336 n=1 Tax=Styela clava TaxID=7725 RepID=UPI00193AB49D|nr:uncharacterized protein LOC120343336 [Styela clava]